MGGAPPRSLAHDAPSERRTIVAGRITRALMSLLPSAAEGDTVRPPAARRVSYSLRTSLYRCIAGTSHTWELPSGCCGSPPLVGEGYRGERIAAIGTSPQVRQCQSVLSHALPSVDSGGFHPAEYNAHCILEADVYRPRCTNPCVAGQRRAGRRATSGALADR